MLPPMENQAEIDDFLNRIDPPLVGVVGTLNKDGSPHIVPVWYRYDGAAIKIWTKQGRTWVENLARDSRAAFSVQQMEYPYAAVVIQGRAEITTGDGADISAEILRITRRYIDDEAEVQNYIQRWTGLRTIVSIIPEKVSAWGEGY